MCYNHKEIEDKVIKMNCIGDYLENTVIYDRNLHGINELAGQIELGRLSLTSLLSIHAIISESEQLEDLAALKLLNIVYLHISERLSFVPKGRPFGNIFILKKHLVSLLNMFSMPKSYY